MAGLVRKGVSWDQLNSLESQTCDIALPGLLVFIPQGQSRGRRAAQKVHVAKVYVPSSLARTKPSGSSRHLAGQTGVCRPVVPSGLSNGAVLFSN